MARPKTRTVRHPLMLTSQEYQDWSARAQATGINLSEYIRRCVERRDLAPAPPKINDQTAAQLGKIGNNLNQQIRAMNRAVKAGQALPNLEEIMEVVHATFQLLRELQLELLGLTPVVEESEDDWQDD